MSKFRILHLSDTHFRLKYKRQLEKMGIDYFPPHVLETFLKTMQFQGFDMVVITGDLVHEGDAADYKAFQKLINQYIPKSLPIYYALGNHDRRDHFYKGMKGLETPRNQEAPRREWLYDYVIDHDDYRFIFLDNFEPESRTAQISDEQGEWLKTQLERAQQDRVIIFMHHPLDILIQEGLPYTEVSDLTRAILQDSKLLGIFAGHVHMNRSTMIGTTPLWTVPSIYCGFHPADQEMYYTNHLGFNVITLDGQRIDVFSDIITPTKKYYRPIK